MEKLETNVEFLTKMKINVFFCGGKILFANEECKIRQFYWIVCFSGVLNKMNSENCGGA